MNYNERIGDNFLKADHVDGEVLQHTDLNELESVVKTAINANYKDIQKMQDGSISVLGASSLKGDDGLATLSQYITETLQPSDNKIPSSLQVKNFVENLVNTVNTGLIFYWDGTSGSDSANIFNQICNKYDSGGKFVFYGLCTIDTGYYNDKGVYVEEPRNIIAPIMVSKISDLQAQGDVDTISFTIPPVYTGERYCIGSIQLTGKWGNYTDVKSIAWAASEAPVKKSEVETIAASTINTTLNENITYTNSGSFAIGDTDANKLFRALFTVSAGRLITIGLSINNTSYNFIGTVTRAEFSKDTTEYYGSIDAISLGINQTFKMKINIHFRLTNPSMSTWTKVDDDTLLYLDIV